MADTAAADLDAATMTDADLADIVAALERPSGSSFRRRWIEFSCQNGVHYGKWATYKNGKRFREEGGYIGRLDAVAALGEYGRRRVAEFAERHACRFPERFQEDLERAYVES